MQNTSRVLVSQILKTFFTALINEEDETERGLMVGGYFELIILLNLPQTPSEACLSQFLKVTLRALIFEEDECERSLIVGSYHELLDTLRQIE